MAIDWTKKTLHIKMNVEAPSTRYIEKSCNKDQSTAQRDIETFGNIGAVKNMVPFTKSVIEAKGLFIVLND